LNKFNSLPKITLRLFSLFFSGVLSLKSSLFSLWLEWDEAVLDLIDGAFPVFWESQVAPGTEAV